MEAKHVIAIGAISIGAAIAGMHILANKLLLDIWEETVSKATTHARTELLTPPTQADKYEARHSKYILGD